MPLFGPPNITKMKENRDIRGLNNALKSKDLEIVREASFALAELNQYTPMLMIGITSKDWKIRRTTYIHYGKFKYVGFIPLIAALHDEHEMVRLAGLLALIYREEKRAVKAVGDCLLNDPSKHVRKGAVSTLFKLGGQDALKYLLQARNDPDEEVRNSVNEVLERLGY